MFKCWIPTLNKVSYVLWLMTPMLCIVKSVSKISQELLHLGIWNLLQTLDTTWTASSCLSIPLFVHFSFAPIFILIKFFVSYSCPLLYSCLEQKCLDLFLPSFSIFPFSISLQCSIYMYREICIFKICSACIGWLWQGLCELCLLSAIFSFWQKNVHKYMY